LTGVSLFRARALDKHQNQETDSLTGYQRPQFWGHIAKDFQRLTPKL
jgi:hypothetical protein